MGLWWGLGIYNLKKLLVILNVAKLNSRLFLLWSYIVLLMDFDKHILNGVEFMSLNLVKVIWYFLKGAHELLKM